MVEKVIDINNENSKPPTPKSRTLYSKPIMANGDNQIMVDIATNGNLKDVHQQNMESEKWRRRSVKQSFKSEEGIDEKGKYPWLKFHRSSFSNVSGFSSQIVHSTYKYYYKTFFF